MAAASSAFEPCFTLVADDGSDQQTVQDLKNALQRGSDEVKIDTLRRIIISSLNGVKQPQLLMPIIQYVLPSKNKQLKKLLHFYWEVCPKLDDEGKLKHEMILVCNAIRNDLQHPNEYIRGATLRFLQKIREAELLEPLVPTILTCLEHRHSYVRKNAIFAIYQIYLSFPHLIPDAAELIQTFLAIESDATCRRNAFVMLVNIDTPRAIEYFMQIYDNIANLDEMLQLGIIELIRKDLKDTKSETPHKPRYIRTIFELLNSTSSTVKYEAAAQLTALTQNPTAVKAAASAYIDLILKETDNNVKLIVLDRFDTLRSKNDSVLDDLIMDILRVLSSPDMDVRRKALAVTLEMISSKNAEDVVSFLKKELSKTSNKEYEKNIEYRQLLIQTIHACATKFSNVAASVVHTLIQSLGDSNDSSATDVIAFVREVVERFPELRPTIVEKLLQTLPDIKRGKVFRGSLWIVGEYGTRLEDINTAFQEIRKVIGEVPILASEQKLLDQVEENEANEASSDPSSQQRPAVKTKVLPDGTYSTETAYSVDDPMTSKLEMIRSANKPPLRALLLSGDFFTGAVLASTLTKLVLRHKEISNDARSLHSLRAEAMLIMTSIIRVGQSHFATAPIDEDSHERILSCLQSLSSTEGLANDENDVEKGISQIFLQDTQAAYAKMVAHEERKSAEKRKRAEAAGGSGSNKSQPDDLISFRIFQKKDNEGTDLDEYEAELARATGVEEAVKEDFLSQLSHVVQLTGFSDTVYAEAYVTLHQFDVDLDVLLVNQTSETLQNLTVEFATLGDLKVSDRPVTQTLAPHSFQSIKTTIKVSSTETGVIFGNIFYDGHVAGDSHAVVLNDIHLDILDYIKPATCTEAQFRNMWTEFEWENKININTPIADLRAYLQSIMDATNMSCLTPEAALSGDCGFLSANLYARSLFGEDALANLSVEKVDDGTLTGHVRIRSKTQGIALALGDKITYAQKPAIALASS